MQVTRNLLKLTSRSIVPNRRYSCVTQHANSPIVTMAFLCIPGSNQDIDLCQKMLQPDRHAHQCAGTAVFIFVCSMRSELTHQPHLLCDWVFALPMQARRSFSPRLHIRHGTRVAAEARTCIDKQQGQDALCKVLPGGNRASRRQPCQPHGRAQGLLWRPGADVGHRHQVRRLRTGWYMCRLNAFVPSWWLMDRATLARAAACVQWPAAHVMCFSSCLQEQQSEGGCEGSSI